MKKPQKFTIENGHVYRLRRATAEVLANEGVLVLVEGDKLETRYPLTKKGEAFFAHNTRGRFVWKDEPSAVSVASDSTTSARKTSPTSFGLPPGLRAVMDRMAESANPESPNYDPTVYPGDVP